jgi:hypothetical protein
VTKSLASEKNNLLILLRQIWHLWQADATVRVWQAYNCFCRFFWGVGHGMCLARSDCFILPGWIISPENAQNAESHFAWSCCIYSACGPADHVSRSSAYTNGAVSLAVSSLHSRRLSFTGDVYSWGWSISVLWRTVKSTTDYWHSLLVKSHVQLQRIVLQCICHHACVLFS